MQYDVSAKKLFNLSQLGFKHATLSGASFSIFDVPQITQEDRNRLRGSNHNKWRELVFDRLNVLSRKLADEEDSNAIAWMIVSGARGAKDQIVQLGGMRGSMFRPNGEPIGVPVIGNFREGLKSYEYWISAPGTRKGMIDKHINTQPAGIIHRKLVETGYPLEIIKKDCKANSGILIQRDWNIPEGISLGKAQRIPFSRRLLGRTLAETIKLGKQTINAGREIDYSLAQLLEQDNRIKKVKVRSPLLCEAKSGLCSKCYGLSLDRLEPQKIGTPVGLIAGHIIGERGVQLAMRTFHTGGASVSEVISSLPRVRRYLGAKEVELPVYKVKNSGYSRELNRWELLSLLINETVESIEELKDKKNIMSINDFLSMMIEANTGYPDGRQASISYFLHVMSFEILSIYEGSIANIHFETLLRSMLTKDGTFKGIFSQAGYQGSTLASASHDRAIQRIFKTAFDKHKDTRIPWRDKFMLGLI
ncbi:MAG: hypothetical protein HY097_01885 [Nitrospinae bacterium]|nr:hypothetical protein [Nitrospinota bacterium]